MYCIYPAPLQWRHNEYDAVSNHRCVGGCFNPLVRAGSKKTSKLRLSGLCEGNSPVTGEFPSQRASNAEKWFHLMPSSCFWNFSIQNKVQPKNSYGFITAIKQPGVNFTTEVTWIRTWISNYNHAFMWDVIALPCLFFLTSTAVLIDWS